MAQDPTANETLEILRIAPGGDGVGRLANGEAVFVPATAPGDFVVLRETKRLQGVLNATRYDLQTPGPSRREPPCPFANRCGGCDFMHLAPEAQRREKLNILDNALARVGGNPERPARTAFVSEGDGLAYRSRVRLRVNKQGQVGYHSARSNQLVPIDRCIVAMPLINEAITRLTELDEAALRRLSFCEQLEFRAVELEPQLSVRLFPRKGVTLRAELYAPLFPRGTLVAVAESSEDKLLCQPIAVTDQVTLRVPIGAFSQVHLSINRQLVAAVVKAATLRNLKSFVDAYAGAGNFALPLLAAGLVGEAVDVGDAGILAARGLARDLGLPFAGFSIGDAKRLLEQFRKNKRRFDYVVLDPPRRGSKEVLELALSLRPRALALIGCDPIALARDLGTLIAKGCTLESLTVFDMFPETHHSETLAILDTQME